MKRMLAEAPTTSGQMTLGVRDVGTMTDAIYRDLAVRYNEQANEFSRGLGGGPFKLRAAWKRRDLKRKARVMAKSLNRTLAKERDKIMDLPSSERRGARRRLTEYKMQQLDGLIDGEARFQARIDLAAHSGFANVKKARVMYFMNLGPDTCPICEEIAGGNPYTIQGASTLGAKAHPNCLCDWQQDWAFDEAMLANAKRQVADREIRMWDGKPRTPARGPVERRLNLMHERKGGWKGRRIEQKKRATLRAKEQKPKKPAIGRSFARIKLPLTRRRIPVRLPEQYPPPR